MQPIIQLTIDQPSVIRLIVGFEVEDHRPSLWHLIPWNVTRLVGVFDQPPTLLDVHTLGGAPQAAWGTTTLGALVLRKQLGEPQRYFQLGVNESLAGVIYQAWNNFQGFTKVSSMLMYHIDYDAFRDPFNLEAKIS